MEAKAVEIHGKHINLGDKVKIKYEGKESIGVLSHVLSEPLPVVYIEELDCVNAFYVFRIKEITVLAAKKEKRVKTEEFLCGQCLHKTVCTHVRKEYFKALNHISKLPSYEHIDYNVVCNQFSN